MTKTNAVGAWISPRRLSLHMGITAIIVAVGVFAGAAEALNASRVEVVGDTTHFDVDGCHSVSGASIRLPEGTQRIEPVDPAPGSELRHGGKPVAEVTKVDFARRGGQPFAFFTARPLLECSHEVPSKPRYCGREGEEVLCPRQPPPTVTPEPPTIRLGPVKVEVRAFVHGDFPVWVRMPGSGANEMRPGRLPLTADGAVFLLGLHWTRWGGRTAAATGRLYVNTCDPFCAAEQFEMRQARIQFRRPSYFGERYHYTRLKIKVLGGAIPGFHPSRFRRL